MLIIEKIKPIFEEKYMFEGELNEGMSLRDDLGLDSIDLIETVTDLEELFDIQIKDEEIADFKTVGDVIRYLETKVPEVQ